MDRDRDEPRRMPGRNRGEDRSDPVSGKFDPAEFDALPAPSPAARARGDADAAQAFSMFSAIDTGIQRLLANFGMIRDLVADVRASVADNAARDAQRAVEEAARDKAIAARLIDPAALGAHARAGARQGAADAFMAAADELKRQSEADTAVRAALNDRFTADAADRRAYETRRRRQDNWRNGALAGFALLVPISLGYGYHLGEDVGDASAYARSRDEVAAASWANTPNGKLARQLDQASQLTIPDIAGCPKGNGWHSEKRQGVRYCFATNEDRKSVTGWPMP